VQGVSLALAPRPHLSSTASAPKLASFRGSVLVAAGHRIVRARAVGDPSVISRGSSWVTLTVSAREGGPRLPGIGTSSPGPVGVAPGVAGVGVAPPGARVLLAMVAGALAVGPVPWVVSALASSGGVGGVASALTLGLVPAAVVASSRNHH